MRLGLRSPRGRRPRLRRAATFLLGLLLALDLLLISSTRRQAQLLQDRPQSKLPRLRVFIASIHWNNEAVLRSAWNDALLAVVQQLGRENVYLSVYESGSWDDTKGALRELDATMQQLGVARTIILDKSTHAEDIDRPDKDRRQGWIETGRGRGKELRRVPYLARLRNRSLEPLMNAANGTRFDRVLLLNDVVFTVDDVMSLLATRDGEYAAACSMDYAKPPAYYDTFALRDDAGQEAVAATFPYFRSPNSRRAMIRAQPIPVQSCWNGIVAFDAAPFVDLQNPLRFRGISDTLASYHLEGSECCLIHADNALSKTKGVWLNPLVRVGYSQAAYDQVHPSAAVGWPSWQETVTGMWKNRVLRWSTTTFFKTRRVRARVQRWTKKENLRETGPQCLINEMQVLVENGWAHV